MREVWEPRSFSYGESGVDVDIEAKASRILYEASKETTVNRSERLGKVEYIRDNFRGVRATHIGELPTGTVKYEFADGVGSKTQIASLAGNYRTTAFDLFEASGLDAACRGYEPEHFVSYLRVNTLGQNDERLMYIQDIAAGMVEAADCLGVCISNGELAQDITMGHLEDFRFEMFGVTTAVGHESRLVDGSDIRAGDTLVGFYEPGFRTNGYSLIIDIFEYYYGKDWGEEIFAGQRLADLALKQSELFTPVMVDISGGYDLERQALATFNGATNVSGGGVPEKLGSLLEASNLGAIIDRPFSPPAPMALAQRLGQVPDTEAYRALCMGTGLIVATREPDQVIKVGQKHKKICRQIGQVTGSSGIAVVSRGEENPGKLIHF